jgi:hypothetical protein
MLTPLPFPQTLLFPFRYLIIENNAIAVPLKQQSKFPPQSRLRARRKTACRCWCRIRSRTISRRRGALPKTCRPPLLFVALLDVIELTKSELWYLIKAPSALNPKSIVPRKIDAVCPGRSYNL